jgi:mannose/cellobiose epimerase-like protein (N-acyl-D-glucosamine 2-epimerase family)
MRVDSMDLATWMKEAALPFWAERGVDRAHGGFIERLTQDGTPSDTGFKRVRVQGRQLYAFSNAAILGWNPRAEEIADYGFQFLKKARVDNEGSWARRLSTDGAILDAEMDLYDAAFVVLGLITYHRLTGSQEALFLVETTLRRVRTLLAVPPKSGYRQSVAENGILRQNPNMHWFEAMLFCFEATKDPRYLDEVKRIYQRAAEDIIDSRTGALREVFDDQWNPAQEKGKVLVEPGHHYEWTWLLKRASRHFSVDTTLIPKVAGFADRYGLNNSQNLVYDQVTDQGEVTESTTRLWVLTETIKAWLVRPDVTEEKRVEKVREYESSLLRHFLQREPMGTWADRLDADGRVHDGPVPSSSMYHIMLATTELAAWREKK